MSISNIDKIREKVEKLKKLADAMYYAAQQLATDASRLHKAMDEYHQFIINEYHKDEPKECMYSKDNYTDEDRKALCDGCEEECIEMMNEERKRDLSLWSLGDFANKFFEITEPYKDSRNYKNLCIRLVIWQSELWRWIHWKKRKEEPVSEEQVKEPTKTQHVKETCKENGNSLTQEPVSEDLEKEIDSYFAKWLQGASDEGCFNPDSQLVSIYDCRRIARHFAAWQKQQMMAKAVDVTIAIPYQNGYGGYTQLVDSKDGLPFGENLKVLVIKE